MTISVLRCGIGNHASVVRMIQKLGGDAQYVSTADEVVNSSKLILPGVGHFGEGMKRLNDSNLGDAICEFASNENRKLLGICLGMQLLCENSEESKGKGLGLIPATVELFRFNSESKLKVPHMGWNTVEVTGNSVLFSDLDSERRYYFVHSYFVRPKQAEITTGTCLYGYNFCAAFEKNNIFGVQFHPEKSHKFGMALFRRFLEL